MAQAYNKSTAGIIHEIMHGKPKYDVGQAEGWLDEAGQFFVGLASPIDMISFFGSGMVGGAVAKKIGSNTLKKWALSGSKEMMKKQAAKKGISKEFHQYLAREAGLESGFSLGALGATHGALAESAKQSGEIERGERDNFNPWAITGHALKHGATNVALGSVAGFYTKGKMAPKFAKAKMATEKDFQNKLTRLTMNPLGQVAAEAAVFTTGQLGEQAIAGQPVTFDDFLSGFFMNSAIVGGMRTMTKPLRLGQNDATRYAKAKKEFYKDVYKDVNNKKAKTKYQQTLDSLKETEKALEEAGVKIPKEVGERIAELELAKERDLGAASQFNTLMKDYGKILNELNEKGASSLPKETQVKLMTELGTIQTVLNKIYRDFKADKELAYEAYKDYFGGKKLTDKQKDLIDALIDTKIETTQRGHDMLNGLINGDKDAIKNMKELYSEGFETSVTKNKKGKWELSLETPEGNLAELPSYYRIFNTEAAAKKAGKSIKESIKRNITKDEIKESGVKKAEGETYYTPINPQTKQPLVDNLGNKIVRSAPKEEVASLIAQGKAVKPGFNLTNKNQSNKEVSDSILGEVLTEVKEIKEMGISEQAVSYDMPVKKGVYDKLVKEYNEFHAAPKGKAKSGELNRLKKEVWESGDSKDIISSLAGSDADLITAYKMGETLYAKGLATTPSKNTKVAIKLIGYLNSKNKKLHELTAGELADIVKGGIPKYEISFIKDGKTVIKTISSKDMYSSSGVSSLRQIVTSLRSLDFITDTKKTLMKSVLEGFDRALNEARGKNIKPAKERVRRNLLERAEQLSKNKNDEGYSIAAKLASKFLIRDEEINRMSPKKLKEALKKDGDDYYLDMAELKKYKTKDRLVWIDKDLGVRLENFTGDLSKGKYVTEIGRITPSDNTKRLTDTRRRAQTIGAKKLGGAQFRELNYLLGHEVTKIQEIYNVSDIASVIKSQKELHKKIGSPISELNPTNREFYKIGETKIKGDTAKEVHYARKKRLGEKYSEVVIELVKEFKDKSIPKDAVGYLEKAENWAIKVKMGKAPSDTIPHEVSHYVFKVMDAVGRAYKNQNLPKDVAKTMKLIKEAKKLFVNKKGKFVEEDAVIMIGKAIDGQLQKPMMAKAKSFFKRFNVWLKGLFNKPMTKEELSFILGERVLERKGIPNPKELGLDLTQGREYMQTMELDIGKFKNVVNRDVRIASKEMGIKRTDLINFVAQEAGIPNHNKFRLSLPKDQTADIFFEKTQQLRDFYTTFKSFNLDKFVQKENALKKLRIIRRIESLDVRETESRIAKGITKEAQKSILKNSFGVKDGNLWNASYDQLNRYNDYMYQLKTLDRNHVDWVLKSEINEFANLDVAKGALKTWQEGLMLFGETGDAIGSVGLKTLQSKLNHHYSVQQGNEGALMTYEANVTSIIGGVRANAKMNKINDRLWTLDNRGEMLLEQLKWMDKKISKADKKHARKSEKFFRKAIKDNWWDTVKLNKSTGREIGDALNAKNKKGEFKYLNLDTVEGKIALEYFKLSDAYGEKKLKMSLLDKSSNEAEYQGMLENAEVDFLSTHIARNFTDHGKHVLRLEGKAQRDSLNKMAEEIAYNEAVRRFGKEAVDKDLGIIKRGEDSPYEYGLGLAAMKFHDMMQFNPAKLSIKHLKKRFSMQELYLEDGNGKLHRTYEWKFDRTVKPYVWGMSKFYATLEVFPEMAKFEGFNKPGVKEQLAKLSIGEGRGRKIGRWVEDAVMRQLGLDTSSNPYDITFRSMETAARTLAKTGLSFPTSGVKNIFTGQTQSLYALKAHDWFRGMIEVFTADSKKYNEAVATNAFGVGNKIYEAKNSGQMSKIANTLSDWAFSFGGMRVTERFNRLSTIFAAKHDINRQINTLRSYKPGDKQYKKAETRLKWYEVTPEEVKLLAKFGSSEGAKHLKGFEKLQTMRRLDNIHQKMNTYAHVKTQGSSADLFMPKWAGTRAAKPLTLFKRMAFAATSNTFKNLKQARDERNIIKPVMGLTATYLSGQAMLGIYRTVLGTHMPKENSDWWTRFQTVMWKGELFGILSDWASPFDNSDTLNPAIWNSVGSVFVAVDQLVDGKVTKSQAFDQIAKSNLSAYNNYIKMKERTNNPLNKDRLRFGKLYRDFEEEVFETPNITLENTTRTKYFKDLSAVFYDNNTTDKEWAEQLALTYVGLAHDYFRTNRADTKAGAFKLAKKTLKQKLTGLNPNKATLFKKRRAGKVTSLKFYKWLSKHSESETLIPRLLEIEKEYKMRLGKFQKSVPGIWKKMNIEKMIDDFDWTQIEY
jgi:sulfur relay (sulfurtransferase) DsrC/TusE family protein